MCKVPWLSDLAWGDWWKLKKKKRILLDVSYSISMKTPQSLLTRPNFEDKNCPSASCLKFVKQRLDNQTKATSASFPITVTIHRNSQTIPISWWECCRSPSGYEHNSSSHASRMLVWMNSVLGYGFTVPSLEDSHVPNQYVLRLQPGAASRYSSGSHFTRISEAFELATQSG